MKYPHPYPDEIEQFPEPPPHRHKFVTHGAVLFWSSGPTTGPVLNKFVARTCVVCQFVKSSRTNLHAMPFLEKGYSRWLYNLASMGPTRLKLRDGNLGALERPCRGFWRLSYQDQREAMDLWKSLWIFPDTPWGRWDRFIKYLRRKYPQG